MHSITTTVGVHISERPVNIEVRTLEGKCKPTPILSIGDLTIFCDRSQLAQIRAAIDEYLDPPTLVPDAPDDHWKGRTDAVTLLAPICGGAIEPEYHPTPEDWESYRQWSESIERCHDYYATAPDVRHERID